jgi:hypothetical protein
MGVVFGIAISFGGKKSLSQGSIAGGSGGKKRGEV